MNKKKIVLLVLVVLTIAFIFGQSTAPVKQSSKESSFVTEKIIQPIEEWLTGQKTITNATVRDWAHGVEFAALGLVLSLVVLRKDKVLKTVETLGLMARTFGYGVGIALLDETIQLFNDRGPQIGDVWKDALGLVVGILLGFLVFAVRNAKECEKEKNAAKTNG